ncbi:hydrogenase expression/formation protein HupK [Phaeobacter gallaeciensis]|uniref:hydrogenase expression/formation protein HupK n=1 Tax=Phaeobacter gallaeciensis TaxID=60890 RepID=UPI00237EFC33|nr:hydrogenase expression/formation protein HupK [Phaeobacter gallaeciensis]MDE4099997.1 hydrogenase expression/formation protein HupK [Phaeobacter gallaeciensis]MDE4108811.1 hydrogenase expression/formation protein HupK [Phaeobacter gallaeciensis]MDE4113257.1 hydrogenase expression/formation protein HupK [Phaeobacter gallaeciensis]MDE4117698.1 hydrogenase expression/formation protein HupK [Phaeobacter gallaeciensis]MDE4122201.1 hydrogenase expression/formation protein HupK [Phaeobacter gallae
MAAATYPALRVAPAPALPVDRLVVGKPVEEAAELLPRLFNLCRVAQGTAARAAFGLPLQPGWQAALRAEILRDHVLKLCLKWPGLLSIPAIALPRDWMADAAALRGAVFGPARRLPDTYAGFRAFLETPDGVAPVLRAIARLFASGEACRPALPVSTPETVFDAGAQENSVAGRHAEHPVLRGIEAEIGRGPLWSAAAVAFDLEACLDGTLAPSQFDPGQAVVPAARGFYGVTARVDKGRVAALERIIPTDHLLAPDGALQHTLATVPKIGAEALAPLLLSILDPCSPVSVEPAAPREAAHA